MSYPIELENVQSHGANMGGFVHLLYSIMTDYNNQGANLKTVLEIGVRWGTSTNAFLYGMRDRLRKDPKLTLYSMDIADCSGVVKDDTLRPYWKFIKTDSKVYDWNSPIDVLLIDGDHSYEGVKADYEKYMPFVKDGGVILIHDILWVHKPVIKFFWDEIKYPKSALPLSKSGLGIVYKMDRVPYDESKIRFDHPGIAMGK
jgi:cephalosporin hydroxylase